MGRPVVARYRGTHHFQLAEVETLKIGSTPAAITASAAELNLNDNQVANAVFTITPEDSDVVDVAVQLNDAAGVAMAIPSCLSWYLSSDAAGQVIATAPSGGIAIGVDGLLQEFTANVAGLVTSEADGDFDVEITDTATRTMYLNIIMPTGAIVTSGALAFST